MPSANSCRLCISKNGAFTGQSHMTAAPSSRAALETANEFIKVHCTRGVISRAWYASDTLEKARLLKERMDHALNLLQV